MAIIGEWAVEGELKIDDAYIIIKAWSVWVYLPNFKIAEFCCAYNFIINNNIWSITDRLVSIVFLIIYKFTSIGDTRYIAPHVVKFYYLLVVDVEIYITFEPGSLLYKISIWWIIPHV